jgi:hypothetical protein
MAKRRPAAMMSAAALERATASGSRASRNPGSGWEPRALSTAIFSGSGVRSTRGVDKRLSNKTPPMWGQQGRAWRISRRIRAKSP